MPSVELLKIAVCEQLTDQPFTLFEPHYPAQLRKSAIPCAFAKAIEGRVVVQMMCGPILPIAVYRGNLNNLIEFEGA